MRILIILLHLLAVVAFVFAIMAFVKIPKDAKTIIMTREVVPDVSSEVWEQSPDASVTRRGNRIYVSYDVTTTTVIGVGDSYEIYSFTEARLNGMSVLPNQLSSAFLFVVFNGTVDMEAISTPVVVARKTASTDWAVQCFNSTGANIPIGSQIQGSTIIELFT